MVPFFVRFGECKNLYIYFRNYKSDKVIML
jgi:hypothetical protein